MDGHPLEQNPQRKSDHAANNAGCHLAFTSFLPPNRAAFSRAGTHRLRRGRGLSPSHIPFSKRSQIVYIRFLYFYLSFLYNCNE